MKQTFPKKIISHPDLRGGEPCIKGTRIPVRGGIKNRERHKNGHRVATFCAVLKGC
jgi:uncharacterized protein (DUF433 family)